MSPSYFDIEGEIINPEELRIVRARDLAVALQQRDSPFARLIECRRTLSPNGEKEAVVFKVEVELGQVRCCDIQRQEIIAAVFSQEDATHPDVLALRKDFPKIPHLSLKENEFPRSLCLYEEKFVDLKPYWTSIRFVERIRQWLSLSAKGKLHDMGQSLEPLLLGTVGNLIIPFEVFAKGKSPELGSIYLRGIESDTGRITLIAEKEKRRDDAEFVTMLFQGCAQVHGVISRTPLNLKELHDFLENAGIDFLNQLRERLMGWHEKLSHRNLFNARLMLLVSLPKKRIAEGGIEITDIYALLTLKNTVIEIGQELGIWEIKNGVVSLLSPVDISKQGKSVSIALLNPVASFSRNNAHIFNGSSNRFDKKIALIGLGALGSQLFMNLVRFGFGEWKLIDSDIFLPHNIARHTLGKCAVGYAKASYMAYFANQIIDGEDIAIPIIADVMSPNAKLVLEHVDIIMDISTSVAVARYLARDIISPARRISIFLNPSGYDSVMLSEDLNREIPLDCLEMQYYRYLISTSGMENHLQGNNGSIRYARSCGDISNSIPQTLVALHAAICGHVVQMAALSEAATISIWQANSTTLSVKRHDVQPRKIVKYDIGGWILFTDQLLLEKIYELREKKLPNETGGVLIGSFDMERKIIYIVDTLLSPPDSQEWPAIYIRGCQGLRKQVKVIGEITQEKLEYVGEWHSHPIGCDSNPSSDDRRAFSWFSKMRKSEGLPAIMLIAGDNNDYKLYVDKMT